MKKEVTAGEGICHLRVKALKMTAFRDKLTSLFNKLTSVLMKVTSVQTLSPYTPYPFTHSRQFFHRIGRKLSPYAPPHFPAFRHHVPLPRKPIPPIPPSAQALNLNLRRDTPYKFYRKTITTPVRFVISSTFPLKLTLCIAESIPVTTGVPVALPQIP